MYSISPHKSDRKEANTMKINFKQYPGCCDDDDDQGGCCGGGKGN